MREQRFKTAFILGAGLGTRLKPLTDRRPKPLLPIGGRPVITYAMDHCLSVGIERFIVNTHHCPEAYHREFPDGTWRGRPIVFRHEPVLLDTAGGLKNIEDLLEEDRSILCYNGDILTNLPLQKLLDSHERNRPEVTLALRTVGHLLNVCIDAAGNVVDIRNQFKIAGVQTCQFACIYVVEKTLLRHIEAGKIESIATTFIRRIAAGRGHIRGVTIDEGFWHDIGSIEVYERLANRNDTLEGF